MDSRVISCSYVTDNIENAGAKAEVETTKFLLDNLNISRVGEYRILLNYNLPYQNRGGRGTLELDMVVIDRLGIFAVEVKDLHGHIESHDGYWLQNQKYKLKDFFSILQNKSRILYGRFLERFPNMPDASMVSVTPVMVLFQGTRNFVNKSVDNVTFVAGTDNDLIEMLSSTRWLRKGQVSRPLSNDEIKQIADMLYGGGGRSHETIIGNYRVIGELSPGDTFEAFEGLHNEISNKRARIKVYKLPLLSEQSDRDKVRRDAVTISKLGYHPHILQTFDFLQDPSQADTFYEITEPVEGSRLDEFINQYDGSIPLEIQLNCVEQLGSALLYIHDQNIYHRNINPETIYIIRGDTLKLADFDIAKIVGNETVFRPGDKILKSPFVAPELIGDPHSAKPVSDIYSLGVIWFILASLPNKSPALSNQNIDNLILPEKVRALIKSMTERVPANRPQNAKKILEKIEIIRSEMTHSDKSLT